MKRTKKTTKKVKRDVLKIGLMIVLVAFIGFLTKNEALKSPAVKELPKMIQSITQPAIASNLAATTTISAIPAEPTDMKEWVKWKTGQAGMKWEDVKCLIDNESGWDDQAIGVNSKKYLGVDLGLWQINTIHHTDISNEDKLNYKKATNHAIEIWKSRGKNYSAWYGFINNCQ